MVLGKPEERTQRRVILYVLVKVQKYDADGGEQYNLNMGKV
jgi:hypothetical protein